MTKSIWTAYIICITLSYLTILPGRAGETAVPSATQATLSWTRDFDQPMILPKITVNNPGDTAIKGELRFVVTNAEGEKIAEKILIYEVVSGGQNEYVGFPEQVADNEIVLATVSGEGLIAQQSGHRLDTETLSGVFGYSRALPKSASDSLIAMNVHLERYAPAIRWRLMQMLVDAGVKSVRIDSSFTHPDNTEGKRKALQQLDETILGLEAFGIEPLVCIVYFPNGFHTHPQKQQLAYEWARLCAERYRGRAAWHYGNETNSGWAAYGAATDMAALNQAFALGTRAGDPAALRGSFGIAEGLPGYLETLLKTNLGDYLEAIAIHPYSGTAETGIAKILANRQQLRPDQQIWATEIGYHVDVTPGAINALTGQLTQVMGFSIDQQVDMLTRLYTLGRATAVDRIYWYDFYGLQDKETFWLVDADFTPRPAYHALVQVAKQLKNVVYLGGTGLEEAVQRHYFLKSDKRLLLVAWTLAGESNLDIPIQTTVVDALGQTPSLLDNRLTLTGRPVFIEIPADNQFASFINHNILTSCLDKRSFGQPMSRFTFAPGQSVTIPFTLFNAGTDQIIATPRLLRSNPGWTMSTTDAVTLDASATITIPLTLTPPENVTPGVEYDFIFAADLANGQRTSPFTIRVKASGEFPYQVYLDHTRSVDYPMWDALKEIGLETGNPELTASNNRAIVDGDISEWNTDEFYPLDQCLTWILRDPKLPSREDFNVKVAFRYQDDYLYAAFIYLDDQLSVSDQTSRDWRDCDNFRIFLSTEADSAKRGKVVSEKELLFIMAITDVSGTGDPVGFAASLGGYQRPGFEGKVRLTARTWKGGGTLEVSIPWSELNVKPQTGMILGLNVMADDADGGFRRHTAMTRLQNANYWQAPNSLGSLRLR